MNRLGLLLLGSVLLCVASCGRTMLDTPGVAGTGTGGQDAQIQSAMDVCKAAIATNCARTRICVGDLVAGDCTRFANLCPDYYFSSDSKGTVETVSACMRAFAARACSDYVLNFLPACYPSGKLPAGSACFSSTQCMSGGCAGASSGSTCKTCQPGGTVSVGGPCASSRDCQGGAFCHRTTNICTDASTIVYATEGEPCDHYSTPVVGCKGDLLCIVPLGWSSAGICQPAPGAGQPCARVEGFSSICTPGTVCTGVGGGTCQPVGACGSGVQCDQSSYCRTDGQVCAPRANLGQACGDPSTSSLPPCLAPAVCVPSTGLCRLAGARGDTCDMDHPCATLLTCTSGTCEPPAPMSCPADGGEV
jgi:hypothetical protein